MFPGAKRACVRTKKKPQISPLRYPEFPVEFGGVGELHAATSSDASQEIRVRSGRDDKFVELCKAVHRLEKPQFTQNKFVISTGAKRSGEICGFFLVHPQARSL
jgi:hypothetical protein